MSIPGLIYIFLSKYLVPALFVIGLLYFLYGFIKYFIISDKSSGRELFLKAVGWFSVALLVHLLVLFLSWIGSLSFEPPPVPVGGGASVDREPSGVLQVPNTPRR